MKTIPDQILSPNIEPNIGPNGKPNIEPNIKPEIERNVRSKSLFWPRFFLPNIFGTNVFEQKKTTKTTTTTMILMGFDTIEINLVYYSLLVPCHLFFTANLMYPDHQAHHVPDPALQTLLELHKPIDQYCLGMCIACRSR